MISFVRVDNRLIHGQVVEAWLPHLKVHRIVVTDDEAADSPLVRAAMGIAVPGSIEVQVAPRGSVDYGALAQDAVKTLFLFRNVADVVEARSRGLELTQLNLGNVHHGGERRQVSASVFLTEEELHSLQALAAAGVEVEVRAVPAESPVALGDITGRFERGG